jgi:DNA (cytosine-5)-methyltransferase 1
LLWEVERLLLNAKETNTLPRYLLLENVKNLIGKQFKANYGEWLAFLTGIGYTTYTKVLNAKNYGIPQNRERVFGISILGEHTPFIFPEPVPLTKRLKDVLDDEVDERYYLKDSTVLSILTSHFHQRRGLIQHPNEISKTLLTRDHHEPRCVVVGKLDQGVWENRFNSIRSVYSPEGVAPTQCAGGGGGTETKIIIDDLYKGREPRFYNNTAPTIRSRHADTNERSEGVSGVQRPDFKVLAMRGRNPNNPSDRTAGVPTVQRLEENKSSGEYTNTITTVQKDNLIVTKNYEKFTSENGYIPELFNAYNCRELVDIAPTQTGNCGAAGSSASVLIQVSDSEHVSGAVGEQKLENCRIRKLTPRECWRLMGWADEQIGKVIACGICPPMASDTRTRKGACMSNAQMYKQAGNGIVVQVLEAIFRNLFAADV